MRLPPASRHLAGLLSTPYRPGQMPYDLRRLRRHGLIQRLPRTNRYVLTPDGLRVAVFYTKVHNRLLRPLLAADQPQAPPELRAALTALDRSYRRKLWMSPWHESAAYLPP